MKILCSKADRLEKISVYWFSDWPARNNTIKGRGGVYKE